MDANQRSEVNNQTNNLANEKGTPGSKGKTADDGPLDHTYPDGLAARQHDDQGVDTMGAGPDVQQQGVPKPGNQSHTPGGSMQNEMSGGSGTVQGITDSHQRVMDQQKSGAYGILEEPVGHQRGTSAVNVNVPHQGGSMQSGRAASGSQGNTGGTGGGGMHGPQSAPTNLNAGSSTGNRQQGSSLYVSDNSVRSGGGMRGPLSGSQGNGQEAQRGNTQLGVSGSHSMANQNSDVGGVHESNDVAGGLPRSPGNTGAQRSATSTDRAGSQTGPGGAEGGPPAHESNDAAGGYPRSPGYANKLHGDDNMDDDTGFKRKP